MREKGIRLKSKRRLQIEQVFYAGDDGGIMCGLKGIEDEQRAYVVSITHIKIVPRHPLRQAIKAYQRLRRTRLLAQPDYAGSVASEIMPNREQPGS